MSARRVLAGSALALILPASLLLNTETGSATGSDSADAPRRRPSPPRRPARRSAGGAARRSSSPGSAPPASTGQGLRDRDHQAGQGRPQGGPRAANGSSWKKVGTAKQEKSGKACFKAAVSKGGLALTYRVTAQKQGSLKAVKSSSVDTSRWLTPTFTDEFSGSTLNPVWGMRGQDYQPDSKRACSKGDPSAVDVSGGALRLSVIKDKSRSDKCKAVSRKQTKKISYRLNGHVGTDQGFSFRYGVASARVKMQKLQGQHASFWLQPVGENQPGSDGHEIDVIEYFGDKHPQGGLTSFIHWYKGQRLIKTGSWIKNSTSFLQNKRDGWSKNYHVFSVQWTPKVIIFYIDGKETWRTSARVSKTQQYLILSLLASDYEALEMPDSKLPQHMYVDWVRVWETPQP